MRVYCFEMFYQFNGIRKRETSVACLKIVNVVAFYSPALNPTKEMSEFLMLIYVECYQIDCVMGFYQIDCVMGFG